MGFILENKVDDKYTISDKLWAGHKRRKEKNKILGRGFGYGLFDENSTYTNTISARYYKDGSEILISQKNKNPRKAVNLDLKISRNLGIGNSTGLGMAPFIVNHPTLLNNWIYAREFALKNIREIKNINKEDSDLFKKCLKKSINNITSWNTESEYQQKKIKSLLNDLTVRLI